jgi:hypothetical protein
VAQDLAVYPLGFHVHGRGRPRHVEPTESARAHLRLNRR